MIMPANGIDSFLSSSVTHLVLAVVIADRAPFISNGTAIASERVVTNRETKPSRSLARLVSQMVVVVCPAPVAVWVVGTSPAWGRGAPSWPRRPLPLVETPPGSPLLTLSSKASPMAQHVSQLRQVLSRGAHLVGCMEVMQGGVEVPGGYWGRGPISCPVTTVTSPTTSGHGEITLALAEPPPVPGVAWSRTAPPTRPRQIGVVAPEECALLEVVDQGVVMVVIVPVVVPVDRVLRAHQVGHGVLRGIAVDAVVGVEPSMVMVLMVVVLLSPAVVVMVVMMAVALVVVVVRSPGMGWKRKE